VGSLEQPAGRLPLRGKASAERHGLNSRALSQPQPDRLRTTSGRNRGLDSGYRATSTEGIRAFVMACVRKPSQRRNFSILGASSPKIEISFVERSATGREYYCQAESKRYDFEVWHRPATCKKPQPERGRQQWWANFILPGRKIARPPRSLSSFIASTTPSTRLPVQLTSARMAPVW
jgi:hypothetical protein